MRAKTAVVLGAQWGDEGKGKIVDVLSERFRAVARYAGGHNAGHTVIIGGQRFVLPLKTELKSTANTPRGKYMSWNEAEFRLYRKFSTESTITFDSPDTPLPEDATKEQPAVPDANDKKPAPATPKKQP